MTKFGGSVKEPQFTSQTHWFLSLSEMWPFCQLLTWISRCCSLVLNLCPQSSPSRARTTLPAASQGTWVRSSCALLLVSTLSRRIWAHAAYAQNVRSENVWKKMRAEVRGNKETGLRSTTGKRSWHTNVINLLQFPVRGCGRGEILGGIWTQTLKYLGRLYRLTLPKQSTTNLLFLGQSFGREHGIKQTASSQSEHQKLVCFQE